VARDPPDVLITGDGMLFRRIGITFAVYGEADAQSVYPV
jgi:hypothetical protein